MPVNFPQQPVPQVPQLGASPGPRLPTNIPNPADIIMQAAQLRQQRLLTQQKMQQETVENLTKTIQTAQSLHEQARQHDMENAMAQATLGMKKGELDAESLLWNAHAKQLEAQARLDDVQARNQGMGGNNGYLDSMAKVHAGTMEPKQFFDAFPTRNNVKANMIAQYNSLFSGDDIEKLQAQWEQKQATAKTAGSSTVQVPAAMAKGVEALSQDLATKAEKLGFTDYPLINKGIIALKTAKGDPDMSDYLLTNMEAQKQLSQVFSAGGAPTDFAQKSAAETMKPELGPTAMRKITSDTIPTMIGARLNALGSIGVGGQQGMPGGQPMTPPMAQQNPAMTGPKMRVIRKSDGMRGTIDPHDYNGDMYQIAQ